MIDSTLLGFILIGFFAQIVDGALGMSYGTISVAFLLTMGVPPVPASSSVHFSKVWASGASGVSHWRLGNVDNRLFMGLLVSGVAGGVVGALVLSGLPGDVVKPFVATYLLLIGLNILRISVRPQAQYQKFVYVLPLGAVGGLLDAVGGGGWGPIVTSTLLVNGQNPRTSIGSVSLAEAFVATAISATFLTRIATIGMDWNIVAGLIIGGVVGAPLSAYLCGKLPTKTLMIAVSILIIGLSSQMLITSILS
jgi:uncharacterized membrane protein YfcA